MTKWMLIALLAGLAVGCAVASAPDGERDEPADTATLGADAVKTGPELSTELTETWRKQKALKVPTWLDEQPGPDVELRALHDGEYLYVFARWADATESTEKKGWAYREGKWQKLKGDEDRIAFAFNISSPAFDKDGCAGACHEGDFRVTDKGGKVDIWHWKAARGGMFSHADDQRLTDAAENPRGDDAGKSAYSNNQNAEGTAPARIWKQDADTAGAFNADTSIELPADWTPAADYRVPSILLRAPEGSRGDIQARGAYKDGHWQVMLKRKLDTGHEDDAVFKVGEEITFSLSVFDDTGAVTGDEHAVSGPIKLVLKR